MKPGTNHIIWALCAFAATGTAILFAGRLDGSDTVYGYGDETAVWMFLGAAAVVGLTGLYLLLIGLRERKQFRGTRASISAEPDHRPRSRDELFLRVMASLTVTDGDLTDDKVEVLRRVLPKSDANPPAGAALPDLLRSAVSGDIASEILAAEHMLDDAARDIILHACYRLLEVMDDPGPVQEELMVRIAAAMGMSELELTAHMDRFERSAAGAGPDGTTEV